MNEHKNTGCMRIQAERQEQIDKHGFDAKHDRELRGGALAIAAVALLLNDWTVWPWPEYRIEKLFNEDDRLKQLTLAGALVAAEIDKLLQAVADREQASADA